MARVARTEEDRSAAKLFATIANYVAKQAGRPIAFALAALVVIVWLVSGPYFGYSDTWQLVINTGTTIITFLMVFLIQNSQNRDSAAIQVKLDELICVSKVKNFYIGIEHLTDEELDEIRAKCESRAAASRAAGKRGNGSTGGKAGKVADKA